MDKRIKMTEKEMCNYFIREQKVMEYGEEFFKDICACMMGTEICKFINDKVLPLSCYNIQEEYLYAVEKKLGYAVCGGFVSAGRQSYIRIGIDASNSILNPTLKKTIRHEIIHYCLWILGLPHDDNSLEFWCLCHVYEGGAYEQLSADDKKYYEVFKELYDAYVVNLQWNVKHLITGQMITGICKTAIDDYANFVHGMINNVKRIYDLE